MYRINRCCLSGVMGVDKIRFLHQKQSYGRKSTVVTTGDKCNCLHPGGFAAQQEGMLVNSKTLLEPIFLTQMLSGCKTRTFGDRNVVIISARYNVAANDVYVRAGLRRSYSSCRATRTSPLHEIICREYFLSASKRSC